MQDARADRPSHPWHWQFRSQLPAMVWPAIPNGNAANTLALLHQLESSQWLSAEALQQRQFSQLELLLRHALGEDTRGWRRETAASGVMMIPIPRRGIYKGVDGVEAARAVPCTMARAQRCV